MPTFRYITVHVTDKDNTPLQEYGIRKSDRAKNTSCYIQSEYDMPFRISIKPSTLPFPEFDTKAEEQQSQQVIPGAPRMSAERLHDIAGRLEAMEDIYAPASGFARRMIVSDIEDGRLRHHVRRRATVFPDTSWEDLLLHVAEFDPEFELQHRALYTLEKFANTHLAEQWHDIYDEAPEPAPYHLMAVLRLDGRSGWEKRSIIILDENDPLFRRPDGETKMVHRTARDADGGLRQCGWYFSKAGIENLMESLNKLLLADITDAVPAGDDDEITKAFRKLGADRLEDTEEPVAAGQIELTFQRVTVNQYRKNQPFSDHEEDQADPGTTVDATKVPHFAARDAGIKRSNIVDTIHYRPYVEDEPPFATFRFYYRDEKTLRKLGFLGGAGTTASAGKSLGQRKATLRNMVGLSISHPIRERVLSGAEDGAQAGVDGAETVAEPAVGTMVFGAEAAVGEEDTGKRAAESESEGELAEGVKKGRKE
ncbi:hypothetical protein LTR48_005374 [Friedmanniomyces endolithicus]|uniref:Uncharacterized protein n=1 Tax=Rachicladosporium monterosium TaxID=1507873 RepID=A0ABR0L216_9PEZI|nr:hypothetical protein LTR29_004755 [Friedmanniomyces endolithicus]KAK1091910.1 hypothetical protein LTR48_005374 [Friedmanniomyces endolithicus]KAK5142271.1 hypothetical protein LTR32_005346 [Rachicladosporium monterosium]